MSPEQAIPVALTLGILNTACALGWTIFMWPWQLKQYRHLKGFLTFSVVIMSGLSGFFLAMGVGAIAAVIGYYTNYQGLRSLVKANYTTLAEIDLLACIIVCGIILLYRLRTVTNRA